MKPAQVFQGEEYPIFMLPGGLAIAAIQLPRPAELRSLAESLHQAGWTVHALLLSGHNAHLEIFPPEMSMQVKTFYLSQTNQPRQLLPHLGTGWILSMIALPIAHFFVGQAALPAVITFSALLQVTLVLTFLVPAWGWRVALRTAITVMGLGWLVEFIGSTTGYPFGVYHYTGLMQPQIGGVPLLIPLAWLMMLPPAWAVARCIVGPHSRLAFIGWSALAMTAWDLFLDPQMVAWGLWVWAQPDGYFGIPWTNFAGWFLASALITALVHPSSLPTRALVVIYAITWLLESLGLLFFWGLPGPALVGFIGMGTILWLAYMKRKT